MRTFIGISLGSLIFLAIPPSEGAECPRGTRNNYKGECVVVAPEDEQIQQVTQETEKAPQNWVEPTTNENGEQGATQSRIFHCSSG